MLLPLFRRSLGYLLIVFIVAASGAANAQLAPVGTHYAQPDSASGGGANYPASVPLDLPPARGGLPLPVALAYGGSRMGAAGRGWDVPLSFVRVRGPQDLAHRRPTSGPGEVPATEQQVSVTLLGQTTELIAKGNNLFVPQRGTEALRAERHLGGGWVLYDGNGLTYNFYEQVGDLWLLKRIDDAMQNKVVLDYAVEETKVGSRTHYTVDLLGLQYNHHPASGVPKHGVSLHYGDPQDEPQSIAVAGDYTLRRFRNLESIEVWSRPEPAGDPQRLREYQLHYSADPDTGLPRLTSVKLAGRAGAEPAEPLILARYEYGTATTPSDLPVPTGQFSNGQDGSETPGVALKYGAPYETPLSGIDSLTGALVTTNKSGSDSWRVNRVLSDVTGDGRADLVFNSGNGLKVARNRPGPDGSSVLNDAALHGAFSDAVMTADHLGAHRSRELSPRFQEYRTESVTDTFRQFADVNGDGRPDLIVADEKELTWVYYINSPPNGPAQPPHNTQWLRRERSVAHLAQLLESYGHGPYSSQTSTKYLPLMRESTAQGFDVNICWRWDDRDGNWSQVESPEFVLVDDFDEQGRPIQVWKRTVCGKAPELKAWRGQMTTVAWKLLDFNGDGGLDLVLNSAALRTDTQEPEPPHHSGPGDSPATRKYRPYISEGNRVELVYSLSGIDTVPASNPSVLWSEVSASGSRGFDTWEQIGCAPDVSCDQSVTNRTQAFQDINGDGLMDHGAALGNGRAFVGSYPMGSYTSGFRNSREDLCVHSNASTYSTRMIRGYRDLTGDGLPDYVEVLGGTIGTEDEVARVRINTGAGFRSPVRLDSAAGLSSSSASCDGEDFNSTEYGLYDLDGDGRPERVASVAGANPRLVVTQLVGSSGPRALSAGLLTAIENGHGARIEIDYVSAKDDNTTRHQVPYPEIVVGEVRTTQASTGQTAVTRYAYGNPIFGFDSLKHRFRSYGYGRTVAMTLADESTTVGEGVTATVTDAWPLGAAASGNEAESFARHLRAGRPLDVTTVASALLVNPRGLLNADLGNLLGLQILGRTSYTYDQRVSGHDSGPPAEPHCQDVMDPYVQTTSNMNTCTAHGFVYADTTETWRGKIGGVTGNTHEKSAVRAMDEFGRAIVVQSFNDTSTTMDDVCTQTSYADPVGGQLRRVLSAASEQKVGTCTASGRGIDTVLAAERTYYDGLALGQVTKGLATSHTTERRDSLTGELLQTIQDFVATYDAVGNVATITSEDGSRRRIISADYDPFGLVVVQQSVEGRTDAASSTTLTTTTEYEPLTMQPVLTTDPNGAQNGATYDAFGRQVLSTVTLPDGTSGVVSRTTYHGFEDGAGPRLVKVKSFANPVPEAQVSVAAGQLVTTMLDDLGRPVGSVADLGSDYAESMTVDDVTFDALGRVAFAADPYPSSQPVETAYGTSFYYNLDGTLKCEIRGHGPQPFTAATDVEQEIFPTCYERLYVGGRQLLHVTLPDSLDAGADQAGVVYTTESTAIGRVIRKRTGQRTQNGTHYTLLENSEFAYDRLGNLVVHDRDLLENEPLPFEDPKDTRSRFTYDSLGQVRSISEPGMATRFNSYTSWGELKEVRTPASSNPATPERIQRMSYDGFGRLLTSESLENGAIVPETVYKYAYDIGTSIHSAQPSSHTLGRMTRATSSTSDIHLGYDALGRPVARATRDADGAVYVETAAFDLDGAAKESGLRLPDTGHQLEKMTYTYDSARRLRTATFIDQQGASRSLFDAQEIDAFGRLREAELGAGASYAANYADMGRRLFSGVTLQSADGAQRSIGISSYDAIGRELGREESSGSGVVDSQWHYTRLGEVQRSTVNGTQRNFAYDSLGNTLSHQGADSAHDVHLSYREGVLDQLCRIDMGPDGAPTEVVFGPSVVSTINVTEQSGNMPSDLRITAELRDHWGEFKIELRAPDGTKLFVYGTTSSGGVAGQHTWTVNASSEARNGTWRLLFTPISTDENSEPGGIVRWQMTVPYYETCNVKHDANGNIVEQPTPTGKRTLAYYPSGQVKRIARDDGTVATFRYGALGDVESLDLTGLTADQRRDRRYGAVERRDVVQGGVTTTLLSRNFAVGDMLASRRGSGNDWVLSVGEARGNRFTLDAAGNFVQSLTYDAFGKPESTGPQPGDKQYSREQWNGGDFLAAFGISHLGARLYDPLIGRFLSPDPLVLVRTATTSNPYAFANNDPINSSDPTGLCSPECDGQIHDQLELPTDVYPDYPMGQGPLEDPIRWGGPPRYPHSTPAPTQPALTNEFEPSAAAQLLASFGACAHASGGLQAECYDAQTLAVDAPLLQGINDTLRTGADVLEKGGDPSDILKYGAERRNVAAAKRAEEAYGRYTNFSKGPRGGGESYSQAWNRNAVARNHAREVSQHADRARHLRWGAKKLGRFGGVEGKITLIKQSVDCATERSAADCGGVVWEVADGALMRFPAWWVVKFGYIPYAKWAGGFFSSPDATEGDKLWANMAFQP